MASRPACFVETTAAPVYDRPPRVPPDGVGFRIRSLSDSAGLTRMGVKIREVSPGLAGTHLHYHDLEEEWVWVLSGSGRLRLGPHVVPVREGHFAAFPTGPRPHHFIADQSEPLVLLEGGERRRGEDVCTYPELGIANKDGVDERIDPTTLPPIEADPSQIVHVDGVPERARPHPLNVRSLRHQRDLDRAAGLRRQAVRWVRLEPGIDSTVLHTHEHSDEWVHLLAGEADVRLGDRWHRASAGDFIAFPARGPAHMMRARTPVTYLMGGERLVDDLVTYPELGKRLTSKGFEDIAR